MILLTELLLLFISAGLAFHAWRTESAEFVLVFWSGGAILGLLREWTLVQFTPFYDYGEFSLSILGVPVVMALFWTNFSYVAMRWSENLLDRSLIVARRIDDLLPVVFLVMALISMAVEAFASQYSMIEWRAQSALTLWGGTPVIAPFSYGAMGVLFLLGFRMVWQNWSRDPLRALSVFLFLIPLIILMQLGFLFVIQVGLNLIFAS